jgi:hypothetical protein
MSAGKPFTQRSLAGALLSAVLLASPIAASETLAGSKSSTTTELSSYEPRLDPGDDARAAANLATAATKDPIEQLTETLQKSHIFTLNSRFKILKTDSTIAVSTYKHPYGNENDMKIDALLVAREVLKSHALGINTVRVYFFNESDQSEYTMASVDLELVKQFNSRLLGNAEIVETLKLKHEGVGGGLQKLAQKSYDEIATDVPMAEGILRKERQELVQQIEQLTSAGANVNSLRTAYLLIEDAIRQNDDLGAQAAYAFATELLENAKLKTGISSSR